MMARETKKQTFQQLQTALNQDVIVRVRREPFDTEDLTGFLVGLSGRLLLLHIVDGSTLLLNGYVVVRVGDVTHFSVDASFVLRALHLLGRRPVRQEVINLMDWPSLAQSANHEWPLIMLELEIVEPGVGLIGTVEKATRLEILLGVVDSQAQRIEAEAFRCRDITRMNFGDGYIETLAALLAHESSAI